MTTLIFDLDAEVAEWVASKFPHVEGFGAGRAVGWFAPNGEILGGLVLVPRGGGFDAELSIYLDPRCRPPRRHWRLLFEMAFGAWRLKRLTLHIARANHKARRFAERMGFRQEGALRKGYDGRQTAIVYGMTIDDCFWIK